MSTEPQDRPEVRVVENPDRKRFEAWVGDQLAGVADYIPLPGKVIMSHTEVDGAYEGKGVGGQLVSGALDRLRADGRLVQPLCPYVSSYIRKHPEYEDLVDASTPS